MDLNEQKGVSIKTLFMLGGAFSSYTIGAGFATGQEVLQFFGSWGIPANYVAILVGLVLTIYFTASCYRTGQRMQFENQSEVYRYYCGPIIAWFFDIFSLVLVFGIMISMFSGVGTTINQYFGIPKYVGAVSLGILAAIVVMSGLRRVEQVLGYLGIVIIAYVVIIGIVAVVRADVGLTEATKNLPQYVADGTVLQAGLFGRWHNVILSGATYAGVCQICAVPFLAALGRNTRNRKEAIASGFFSGIFFYAGVVLVVCAILLNLDKIIEIGAQVPILASIQIMLPSIAWTFAIILVAGIFTNIIGYLWLISGRFFEDKSKGQRILVAVLVIAGVFCGSFIPFNQIINLLYPFAGLIGCILMVFQLVKDIREYSKGKKQQPAAE